MSATDERTTAAGSAVAGPLDVFVLRLRAAVGLLARAVSRPVWIVLVVAFLAASIVLALVNSEHPLDLVLLVAVFVLTIVQGLVLVRTRTLSVRALLSIAGAGVSVVVIATILGSGGVTALFAYPVLRGPFPSIDPWLSTFWVPIVSEICKLIPLLAILAWSRRARTMTVGDCLLVGLMTGNGFALTEEITRSGSMQCEYLADLLRFPIVITPCASGLGGYSHAVGTAIIAGAIGLWWRARRRRERQAVFGGIAVLALAWITVGHMAVNSVEAPTGGIGDPWESVAGAIGVTEAVSLVLLALLIVATVVDYRDLAAHGGTIRHLLPAVAGTTSRSRWAAFRDQRVRRLALVRGAYPGGEEADVWTRRDLARLGLLAVPVLLLCGWLNARSGDSQLACLICSWDSGDAMPGVVGGAVGGGAAAAGTGSAPGAEGDSTGAGGAKDKDQAQAKDKDEAQAKDKAEQQARAKDEDEAQAQAQRKDKEQAQGKDKDDTRAQRKDKEQAQANDKEEARAQRKDKDEARAQRKGKDHAHRGGSGGTGTDRGSAEGADGRSGSFDRDGDGRADYAYRERDGVRQEERVDEDGAVTRSEEHADGRGDWVEVEGPDGRSGSFDRDGDGRADYAYRERDGVRQETWVDDDGTVTRSTDADDDSTAEGESGDDDEH